MLFSFNGTWRNDGEHMELVTLDSCTVLVYVSYSEFRFESDPSDIEIYRGYIQAGDSYLIFWNVCVLTDFTG